MSSNPKNDARGSILNAANMHSTFSQPSVLITLYLYSLNAWYWFLVKLWLCLCEIHIHMWWIFDCVGVNLVRTQGPGIYFVSSTSTWCGNIDTFCCRGDRKQYTEAFGANIVWSGVEATNGTVLGPGSGTAPSVHRNSWTSSRHVCCGKSGQGG
jgi:hypothetical protein